MQLSSPEGEGRGGHPPSPPTVVPARPVLHPWGEEPSRRAELRALGGPVFRSGPRVLPCPCFQAVPPLFVPLLSRLLRQGGSNTVVPTPPQCAGRRCLSSSRAHWGGDPLGLPVWRGSALLPWPLDRAMTGASPAPTGISGGKLGMVAEACCGTWEKRLSGTRPSARSAEGL